MIIRIDDYLKSWPWGFIKYNIPSIVDLPDETRCFLRDIGLPKGKEPEWVFTGKLTECEQVEYAFGLHCESLLIITSVGAVYEFLDGNLLVVLRGRG
jgi:hypothetical protein